MSGVVRLTFLRSYAWLFLVLLYGPIILLPIFSFNDAIYMALPLKGFTFGWYRQMASDASMLNALANSIKLGIAVAIISTIAGFLAARALTRYRLPMRELAYGFLLTPLVAPGIIIGFALLMISRKVLGLSLSLITIGAGHVLLCIPLAMLVIIPRLEGLDRSYEEASMDLGEAEWGTFRRVVFPLALPAIVASLFLTFVTSLDEFILAFFLGGNEATLPLYIYGQLRFPDRLPRVLALGSCILVFSSLLILVAEWLSRRSVSNRGTLEHLA